MSTTPTKRRLQLMPEVLPAPNKVDTAPGAVSPVRARTMQRLRALAAVGASIAAACGGSTTGGGGGSTSGGGTSGGGGGGGGSDGGLPDGMKPDTGPGYGVVDPLPPPACFEYANPPTATLVPSADDAGVDASTQSGRYVLDVKWPDAGVAVGDVRADNASFSIEETRQKSSLLELVLLKLQDTGELTGTVTIQTSCAKGPTTVQVTVSEDASGLHTQVNFYGR